MKIQISALLVIGIILNVQSTFADTLADGVTAFEQKQYEQAMAIFVPLANAGDPEAQRRIGEMAYSGLGVKKNFEAAFKWNELAASNGDRVAMYNLGYLYERGEGIAKNQDLAIEWYKKSALKNYPQAQYKLGLIYEQTNPDMALDWYEKAFKQGHVLAEQRYNALGIGLSKKREAEEAENRKFMAEIRRERRDEDTQEEQRRVQAQQQIVGALAQAVNDVANNAVQTQAQTQMIIANAQAAQHRQLEEAREHQREQMMGQSSAAMAGTGRVTNSGSGYGSTDGVPNAARIQAICNQRCSELMTACQQTSQAACYQASSCVKRCYAANAPNDPNVNAWLQGAAQDDQNAAKLGGTPYTFNFGHGSTSSQSSSSPPQDSGDSCQWYPVNGACPRGTDRQSCESQSGSQCICRQNTGAAC